MMATMLWWLPLRDVEHILGGRLVQFATVHWPQAAQYAEQGTLAAAIRTGN